MRKMLGLGLALVAIVTLSAFGTSSSSNTLVRFDGGIGVDPVSNVNTSGSTVTAQANTVRGINPAGQIWVIAELHAKVGTDGSIHVYGRGLVLGGGDGIGTNGGQSVYATLFCGAPASATPFSSNSAGVALDQDGDFMIDDMLSPMPPNPCDSPVLLIRTTSGSGSWFAAGIPK
jgi:hypothetical protein